MKIPRDQLFLKYSNQPVVLCILQTTMPHSKSLRWHVCPILMFDLNIKWSTCLEPTWFYLLICCLIIGWLDISMIFLFSTWVGIQGLLIHCLMSIHYSRWSVVLKFVYGVVWGVWGGLGRFETPCLYFWPSWAHYVQ